MKKTAEIGIALLALCNLIILLTKVWIIVEFILYVFKDNPFNWLSITTLVIFILLSFIIKKFIENNL